MQPKKELIIAAIITLLFMVLASFVASNSHGQEPMEYLTTSAAVVSLTAQDAGSGVKDFSLSPDNANWGEWTAYQAERSNKGEIDYSGFNDGVVCAYARFRDFAGHVSDSVSACVVKDTAPPTNCLVLIENTTAAGD